LGVEEKPENYKGSIVKVRPGIITPLPPNISREMIENNLLSKIQYPIPDLKIVTVKIGPRSKKYVYLIDVPQSKIAPHRVNEIYYFQRYNFTTFEMKHYQIADLFGRRLAPDLEIIIQSKNGLNEDQGHFTLVPLIHNRGNTAAKYVTCICTILSGPYEIMQSRWNVRENKKVCQFSTGFNTVVYPEVPTDSGYIEFKPKHKDTVEPLILSFKLYAEDMQGKEIIKTYLRQ
jgi:hypothetical protein